MAKDSNSSFSNLNDALNMIGYYKKKHDEITRQLNEVYQQTGVTQSYIESFLNNPSNFETKEWERIQRQRQALMKSFGLGAEIQQIKKEKKHAKPAESTRMKERRKTVGARRKWIPMR
jgi:hypothetical protein